MKFSILKLLIAASALLFTFPSFAGNKTGKPVFPSIEIIGTSVPSYNWVAGVDMPLMILYYLMMGLVQLN